jgi:hypothetical protein
MFYHAFAAVPEWAPQHENHILYSEGILKNVSYAEKLVKYTATSDNGIEYLRLSFKPRKITAAGKNIPESKTFTADTYLLKNLGNGDYALTINHKKQCVILING